MNSLTSKLNCLLAIVPTTSNPAEGNNKYLMYQSNQSLNMPPFPRHTLGILQAFDVFTFPGGREFDERSLPGVGHLITTHKGWGI